jgi:hypothetical protein
MSRCSDEFQLDLPPDTAWRACKSAIAQIGWGIASADDSRIVPRVGVGISRNPSKIEVLLGEAQGDLTTLHLNGSIMGIGPIQKRHLVAEMNQLRNAIEVAAAASTG